MPDRSKLLPERLLPSTAGSTVAEYRKMAGMTVRLMAQHIQCSTGSLNRYEHDVIPMKMDAFIRYCRRLGLYVYISDKPPEGEQTQDTHGEQ